MLGLLKKFFGTQQSRLLKKYWKLVPKINAAEEAFQGLSDTALTKKTLEFKGRLKAGELLEDLLPEAFGAVKNACRRLVGEEIQVSGYCQKWDMIPYDVQLVGAIAMFHGSIAEMQTGEGKTLTASLPLYLHALTGDPVHLITVNDYLAKRDCEWMGSIFRKLGLRVSALTNDVPPQERKNIYLSDIVYGTASEFGFDYLRDNSMASHKEEQAQRGHYFAMIDEIDSILIDEARTPLIISGPAPQSYQMYDELKAGVAHLVRIQRDFCTKEATKAKKSLDELRLLDETADVPKLSKEELLKKEAAFKRLWMISKGTPRNKVLKRLKENPDSRADLDRIETYFFGQDSKKEKEELLSELYMIVDERSNEYELTDRGIEEWATYLKESRDDFTMLDLGYEYALIEENEHLDEAGKMQAKAELKEKDARRKERSHNLRQLLRAHLLLEKDIDYIIQDQKIVIIDEHTGRPQPGRRFSDGLHQAIEAKEGTPIQGETQTYATITLQNYFRMYARLAGMTGTAMTEAPEFKEIYELQVLEIPTHRPCQRKDADDAIYMTEREKYHSILEEIKTEHEKGRPILIGTESVEVSEKLSRILKQHHLEHTILNAKNHAKEAEIIAEAGKKKAITLATNMAGRGTDIKLKDGAKECGGLHVVGTTRASSRRIDRQLRGRSGRLGDPGSSQFYVSFEDSLMRLFTSPRMTALLQKFRPPEGEPISASVLNKSIETAQKRVEQRNYSIRKHTLEYDDVMNKQRQEVYAFRNELLTSDEVIEIAEDLFDAVISSLPVEPLETFQKSLSEIFPFSFEQATPETALEKVIQAFQERLQHHKAEILEARSDLKMDETKLDLFLKEVVRNVMIRKVDASWQAHLLSVDHLRSDVMMRTVGQKDPLLEFKHESFHLFEELTYRLKKEIVQDLFLFAMVPSAKTEEKKTSPALA